MKVLSLFAILFFSVLSYAAKEDVYQIQFHILEQGKVLEGGTVVIMYGNTGKMNSRMEDSNDGYQFEVTVREGASKKPVFDYGLSFIRGDKEGKTNGKDLTFTLDQPGTRDFKDADGKDLQFVYKISQGPVDPSKVKKKIQLK